jgi:hypothetical protein
VIPKRISHPGRDNISRSIEPDQNRAVESDQNQVEYHIDHDALANHLCQQFDLLQARLLAALQTLSIARVIVIDAFPALLAENACAVREALQKLGVSVPTFPAYIARRRTGAC